MAQGETESVNELRTLLDDIAQANPVSETDRTNLFWQFQSRAKELLFSAIEPAVLLENKLNKHGVFQLGTPRLSPWRNFLDWLTRPSLPIRLLQDRIASIEAERDKLQDLLTQALERAGVVSVQLEHRGPPPPQIEQRKTYASMQADYQEQKAAEYEAWKLEEAKRRAHVNSPPPS